MRKVLPDLHNRVLTLCDPNILFFTTWSEIETHNNVLNLAAHERPTKLMIRDAMVQWKRRQFLMSGTKSSSKIDRSVLCDFVLNKRHFLCIDKYGLEIPSKKKPRYTRWLSNIDFMLLLKSLGGGNNLLNADCICYQCGLQKRSWEHITQTCGRRGKASTYPRLHLLCDSKRSCVAQIGKLRSLVRRFTPDLRRDIRGCKMSLLDGDNINIYYVTKQFANGSYRCLNLQTDIIETLFLWERYRKGFAAILHWL